MFLLVVLGVVVASGSAVVDSAAVEKGEKGSHEITSFRDKRDEHKERKRKKKKSLVPLTWYFLEISLTWIMGEKRS